MSNEVKNKFGVIVVALILVWGIYMSFLPHGGLQLVNSLYAIGEIHAYDATLFASNLYVGGKM